MLYLTEKDSEIIQKCYYNFLQSLKEHLQNNYIKSSLNYYAIIINLLQKGRFSFNGEMKYLEFFDYLNLSNMNGAQVMYGVGCCRHINLFINDIMQILGFNSTLLYIKIDETDTWHKVMPIMANHVVVTLKDDNDEYLIDAYNNFIFRIVGNDLVPVEIESQNNILMTEYPDDNIKKIGLVLKKYYKLQELGINYLYE